MPDLYIADVSEWQGQINWPAYPYPAVIVRLNYGAGYLDRQRGANIVGARSRCPVRGWYTYLRAGEAPEPQADALADILLAHGGLLGGEFIACDDEEGAGDQAPRVHAYFDRLHVRLNEPYTADWMYAGLYFARTHLGALRPGIHRWLAGYGMAETGDAHELWQYTSSAQVAGISGGVDCSVFHGSLAQLQALVGAAPAPIPAPSEEDLMPNLIVQGDLNAHDPRGLGAVYFVPNFPAGPKRWIPDNPVLAAYQAALLTAYKAAGLDDAKAHALVDIKVVNQYVLDDILDESAHYARVDENALKADLAHVLARVDSIEAELEKLLTPPPAAPTVPPAKAA